LVAKKRSAVTRPASALIRPTRTIPPKTSLFLYVQAGGRCEFDNCNKYLLEHGPTATPGNFAEQAHIWAFNEAGPRGRTEQRPSDINALGNLMLLCGECHHLVDIVHPERYPVEVLKKFKQEHEDRVYALTGLSKDRDTVPLVVKGRVAGRIMDIADEPMQLAVAPNVLRVREKVEIDLTALPDMPNASFWDSGRAIIDSHIDQLNRIVTRPNRTLRVSVFALAPIPLLVYLGARLSDKQIVELYQRHRQPETWNWQEEPGIARFATRRLHEGAGDVALLVNVSGVNGIDAVKPILGACTIYELAVADQPATPLILKSRSDLDHFMAEYLHALAQIRIAHPSLARLHLFPAVPAPLAIVLGRSRLPKVDAPLRVYDHDRRASGFVPALEVS